MNPKNIAKNLGKSSVLIALLLGSAMAKAAVDISTVPLQTGSTVPPNIMFVIDDSGSMHFELLPGEIIHYSSRYIYPRASGIYGSGDYNNRAPTVRDGQPYNALTRSFQNNKSYYNPSITYNPWVNFDGTSFPNADPSCAWHNPMNTGTCPGFTASTSTNSNARNLTVDNSSYNSVRWYRCSSPGSCSNDSSNVSDFWPALYFYFNGGDEWSWSNYTKVEIRPTQTTYTGHGRTNRSDCTSGVCTYAQEIQNFANWYTYYRSRILAARASIGRAFVNQSDKMRVGFATLNEGTSTIDGVSTDVIVNGVRDFSGADKQEFYNQLYGRDIPAAGTPLRAALDAVGRYYSRTDSKGPWGLYPGSGNELSVDHITCRQSFTILMTDGYWSGSTPSGIGEQDGASGSLITRPVGDTGGDFTYTPVSPFKDSHSDTLADVAMKYWKTNLRPDLKNQVPTSTINPAFWQHMVTFGVGFGVTGNVDASDAFAAINSGIDISWPDPSSSDEAKLDDLLHASVNGRGGFFTADEPEEFAQRLENTLTAILDRVASATNLAGTTTSTQADDFVFQGSFNSGAWSGSLKSFNILNPTIPVWESSFPTWYTRNIIFGKQNGAAAMFTGSNVNADLNALTGNEDLVDYLRGDRTYETGSGSKFRARSSILGDIANSSPLYVAAPVNRNFQRYGWVGASSYGQFLKDHINRKPMVYVGSNDGMLHAFNGETGVEEMAYVPSYMLTLAADWADYASMTYQHKYYVDGSPSVHDVYIDNQWKSVLIGSLGRGGDSLFALDITSPTDLQSTPTSALLWDKRFADLSISVNKPVVARLNNDKWAVLVGYGYNNPSGKAGLLVIDIETGAILKQLETTSGVDNGMGRVEGWDEDGDGNTDWFFGGDLHGNIWKFDLSSSNTSEWNVAYSGQPLFVARDASGTRQAITGGVTLSSEPATGYLWLSFGTGKMLSDQDPLATRSNTWYGIKDGVAISSRAQLKQRNIIYEQDNARVIEKGARYEMLTKRGWYIDLTESRERIINTPQLLGQNIVINTITPSSSECNPQGSGWVMSVDAYTGSRLTYNFFDRNRDGYVDEGDSVDITEDGETQKTPVSAIRFDGMPSEPVFFDDKMVVGLSDTRIATIDINRNLRRGRVSWRELINQ